MSVVAVSVSALMIRLVRGRFEPRAGLVAAASAAAAVSVACAILAMAAELALSGASLGSAFSLTIAAHAPFAAWETAMTLVLVIVAARLRAIEPLAASSVR
jgi:hypothetical protein